MIPYSYNMVDMGGIDLAEANRTVVEGLYNRLAIARNACGDLILYNWKFAEIEITPGICNTLDEGTSIVINGLIQVTEQDEVTVLGIAPPPVPVEPLVVTANGVYMAQSPVSGFNPVTVNVPIPHPRLIPITILENGEYTPPSGVDGFNSVTVAVPVTGKEYIYDCGLVEGYPPVNIFNGSQSSDVSYNSDGTAHILGAMYDRRFLGFAVDLTGVSSVEFLCSFRNSNNTNGVIASQTIEDIMNNRSGDITIYPAYTASPPTYRVCKMTLDTSALSGQYYVGILGYEDSWSSNLAQIRINRSAS